MGQQQKFGSETSVELKSHDMKVKRSDSLTKDEKTVCNTKAREKERGHKRFSQRGESALKRRHTVGGTRDFDKVRIRWLTNNNHNHKDDCCCEEENVAASPRWSAWDRLQPHQRRRSQRGSHSEDVDAQRADENQLPGTLPTIGNVCYFPHPVHSPNSTTCYPI